VSDHEKPNLYAHIFDWYCEVIGPSGDARQHFPEGAPAIIPDNIESHGTVDAHGGQQVVAVSGDGKRTMMTCKCSAFLRRRLLAPSLIKL
jgi:hypothetical protein